MTTPSGTIKFTDIEAEFGQNSTRKLGSYRISQSIGGRTWPLDEGIPQSGTIRFSDFRNKTLNVVVDYSGSDSYGASISLTRVTFTVSREAVNTNSISFTASGYPTITFSRGSDGSSQVSKEIYTGVPYRVTGSGALRITNNGLTCGLDDGGGGVDYNDLIVSTTSPGYFYLDGGLIYYIQPAPVTVLGTSKDVYTSSGVVVGGLKPFPSSSTTKKVRHLIRKKIGNGFSSGTWESSTVQLQYIIANGGAIYGAGGRGGNGADIDRPGGNGSNGGNALTISYPASVIVESDGILAGGGGGGGGGGYAYTNAGDADARGAGQGGGGGAGFPGGLGGPGGFITDGGRNNNICQGNSGSVGTLNTGGNGGPVTCNLTGGGNGGAGGRGGNLGNSGIMGNNGNGTDSSLSGGNPGNSGAAIYHPGVTVSVQQQTGGIILGST